MSAHLDDEAQVEAIKSWWRANGRTVLFTSALLLLVGVGWSYWQDRQMNINRAASESYQKLISARNSKDVMDNAVAVAEASKGHIYGVVAQLKLAQQHVVAERYHDAELVLADVVEHANADMFKQIARVRLARLLVLRQDYQGALAELEHEDYSGLHAWVVWVRADCYQALGDIVKAKELYGEALQLFNQNSSAAPLIAMQLASLSTNEQILNQSKSDKKSGVTHEK